MVTKKVVLLSGGLDSSTLLFQLKSKSDSELYALSFNYGQNNNKELHASRIVARKCAVKDHKIINIDFSQFAISALISDGTLAFINEEKEIRDPIPYVPNRNMIFLSIASAYAETIGANEIYLGVNKQDSVGYPDCSKEFIKCFQHTINLSLKKHRFIKVVTPFIDYNKTQIVQIGLEMGLDYRMTFSCYYPTKLGQECDKCHSCLMRNEALFHATKK